MILDSESNDFSDSDYEEMDIANIVEVILLYVALLKMVVAVLRQCTLCSRKSDSRVSPDWWVRCGKEAGLQEQFRRHPTYVRKLEFSGANAEGVYTQCEEKRKTMYEASEVGRKSTWRWLSVVIAIGCEDLENRHSIGCPDTLEHSNGEGSRKLACVRFQNGISIKI
ncbi:hypothetical protein TNCV_1134541 [Trichonephila clavipes]|nr:hypothetical protein TNCV_1134541 [Trichonephila clavipes]